MTMWLIIFAIAYFLISTMLLLVVLPESVRSRLQTYTILGRAFFMAVVLIVILPMVLWVVIETVFNIIFKKGHKRENTDSGRLDAD